MSWTQRLKKVVGASAQPAQTPDELQRDLPPLEPVDAASLEAAEVVDLLADDLVLISDGKLTRDEIEPGGHIFDYGYVDSLSAVVFLVRIEERFGVQIEDMVLVETATDLLALADLIKRGG